MLRLFVTFSLLALLGACSSTPTKTTAEAPLTSPKMATASTAPVSVTETEIQKQERIIKTLASKSVFFDYDDFTIKPEYQDLIKHDYELLKSSPALSISIEGNADERGSVEYNLALGQKRAESVRKALQLMGMPESKMEAISYGEEKPRATCHEEKCWAENRRVDFAYKKP